MIRNHFKLQEKENAQGLVEFALILPILLMLVLGIIEMGRLLFYYSSITSASREGARYGSAVGEGIGDIDRYKDCDGITNSALRAGGFANLTADDIVIQYDNGITVTHNACPPEDFPMIGLADRVVVTANGNFHPVVPLIDVFFPASGLPIVSTTARTIIKQVTIKGTPLPTATPYGDDPTATFTPTGSATPTDTPTPTATYTATPTETPTPTPTNTGTPLPTATQADTPTPTPTPACPSPGSIVSAATKLRFAITNPSPSQVYTITQIRVFWISGPDLKSITFATFSDASNASPPGYTVNPGWSGTFVDQEEMTFTFKSNLGTGQNYNITVDFEGSGGCKSTVSSSYTIP